MDSMQPRARFVARKWPPPIVARHMSRTVSANQTIARGVAYYPRMSAPQLLTVQSVADRMCVGRSTAYDLIARGELPAYRIGQGRTAVRVAESDLAAYLGARKTAAAVVPQQPLAVPMPPTRYKHLRL